MRFSLLILMFFISMNSFGAEVNLENLKVDIPNNFKNINFLELDSLGDIQFSKWKNENGSTIEIMKVINKSGIDKGPAILDSSEKINIGSYETQIHKASMLFGEPINAFVLYLNSSNPKYILVGENVTKSEFIKIISTIKFG